ncbi:uncharacterized protein [Prorops nasuta]|uniref:uncharacterized protein n=1 Tax=Prorops nasuta TaxID=863751 RepID=UPI0034CF179D
MLLLLMTGFLTVIAGSAFSLTPVELGKKSIPFSPRLREIHDGTTSTLSPVVGSLEPGKKILEDDHSGKSENRRKFSTWDEDHVPGIRVYGLPKRKLESNGNIERTEIVTKPAKFEGHPFHFSRASSIRAVRSFPSEVKDQDLEAQDTKVFRPLFVYRQQQAARKRIYRPKTYGTAKPFHPKHY